MRSSPGNFPRIFASRHILRKAGGGTAPRTKTGSFTAMGIIEKISPGLMIADLVAFIASLDVVAPEVDR